MSTNGILVVCGPVVWICETPVWKRLLLRQTTNLLLVEYASSYPFLFWKKIISWNQPRVSHTEISLSAGSPFNPTPGGSPKKEGCEIGCRSLHDFCGLPWFFKEAEAKRTVFLMGTREKTSFRWIFHVHFPPPRKKNPKMVKHTSGKMWRFVVVEAWGSDAWKRIGCSGGTDTSHDLSIWYDERIIYIISMYVLLYTYNHI